MNQKLMKSISIKTDEETFKKLQMITFKASTDSNRKIFMKDIILDSINNYVFKKYGKYITNSELTEQETKEIKRGRKKNV